MLPKYRSPAHPGIILLKDFLEPLEISQKAFAAHLDWTYTRINEIVRGKRGISADSALTLAEAFNMEPEFWLNLQRDWDLWNSKKTHETIRPLLKKAA